MQYDELIYNELVKIRESIERQEEMYQENVKIVKKKNRQAEKQMQNAMNNVPDNLKPMLKGILGVNNE